MFWNLERSNILWAMGIWVLSAYEWYLCLGFHRSVAPQTQSHVECTTMDVFKIGYELCGVKLKSRYLYCKICEKKKNILMGFIYIRVELNSMNTDCNQPEFIERSIFVYNWNIVVFIWFWFSTYRFVMCAQHTKSFWIILSAQDEQFTHLK